MSWHRLLWGVTGVALGLTWGSHDARTGLTWCIGCLLGWMFVRFRFGFAGPIRRLIRERDVRSIYPLTVLIVALVLGSALLIVLPEPLRFDFKLSRVSLGLSLLGGAFLFGIGMQMARRCGSGTLVSVGEGGPEFLLTLLGLILGAFLGSLQRPAIEAVSPSLPPLVLTDSLSVGQSVIVQFALLSILVIIVNSWCFSGSKLMPNTLLLKRVEEQGPWSDLMPALFIASCILLMLIVSGEPWKVLWGMAITGAHIAQSLGWDPSTSGFWYAPGRAALLSNPWNWLSNDAVVVDLALVFGALSARAWMRPAAEGLKSQVTITTFHRRCLDLLPSPVGGLLMGFGGFLSYGCNISSFLGGVQSFSLHGWLWLLAALAGSWVWLKLDALFKA